MRAVGQMGIAGSGENTVVAEDFLHFQQIDTGFDQMDCGTFRKLEFAFSLTID
jgi:hypothetical protein